MTQQDDITQRGLTDAEIQALWDEACKDSPQAPGWNRHIRFARALLSRLRAPVADTLPLEAALHVLVDKIVPGLDTGDLVHDAGRASAMLSGIMASAPVAGERAALADLLDYVDSNTCIHESTHRGGAIWTICDGCGAKWADDEGGFVPHQDAPAVAAARAALASVPAAGEAVALELRGVPETIKESDGFWRSCTGCHELNEGRDTGPYSAVLGCHLGQGCSECGGIGAIWDSTDYQTMADDMARDMGQSVSVAPLASAPVADERVAQEYGSPADVAQRIEQYLAQDGRMNSGTQLLYEAMKALRASQGDRNDG